ncbi:phage major capsid protein [Alkaliphilus peptidifermentans]|uniref:Phage major capsid protein, HK97 family n=1 Tax=Alkaliphilus peptidifermentans DSM 18978 TaxID=1120976 RepID=A0A1G5EER6_9FIRM|nr:phage major capsid protein [Alkaliphilus peptidifermentans]SCY25437.1 phage major capsid protein, HK97 family [Alkaliphilus peptidifermentans DSM 18978]
MNKILQLREKRANVWENAKAFLDSRRGENGLLSQEDTTTYEKMEEEVVALGKEIERLERQATLDLELSRATSNPITSKPTNLDEPERKGRGSREYVQAFWNAMKSKSSLDVQNALRIGQDSEGGYLVPDEFEATLIQALNDVNIMRTLAKVITTSYGDRQIPVVSSKGTASWIEEGGAFNESDDTFSQVILGAHKLGTIIKISEELLNDSVFNLENYIATEFARRIGAAEEEAFIKGNGSNKPTGVLNTAQVGITTAIADAITFDEVIDLWHSLREPYRKNATWLLNDSTAKAIRKLKDDNGQYIWQPSVQVGQPDKILNNPVKTSAFMPEIGAGEKVLSFGDYSYYWIADRQGRSFQRLNELYAVNGQVGFRAYQRVDGKLILPEAVKVLTMKSA